MFYRVGVIVSLFFVVGCQSSMTREHDVETLDKMNLTALELAVNEVSEAAVLLGQTNNGMATELLSDAEKSRLIEQEKIVPDGFKRRASLQWHGPLKQALTRIAKMAGMQLSIYGSPSMPIPVSIDVRDTPIIDIYRQLKYSVVNQVSLSVDKKTIHLVYPTHDL